MKSKLTANAAAKAEKKATCPDKAPGRSSLVGKADLSAYSVAGGSVTDISFAHTSVLDAGDDDDEDDDDYDDAEDDAGGDDDDDDTEDDDEDDGTSP